ncbi:CDP-alcohol phosphatidyltransferase family protein [Klenkia taihuensis]|uniref:Phosphatidylglycerophosphate synthase n=1 Tax=Klenkia taihuensis TaxID=1225127 RepID=A0A1I1NUK0_9ACTN|nr:CDP-alcohol phosphatidyltransferase family protein [Klenkia taihuensis]GHE11819.1 CDP-alcohol phosphatidyltransferase [Klenkia taihuensis]SFC99188.1 Phosphatidylglycerophosphate synthase [Klenkia taihuensis]
MTAVLTPARRPEPGETVGATVRRLAGAQKGAKGAPAYSRFVNRPIGRVLAALAFHRGLTPDAVTGLSAVCTFTGLGVVALAPHTWLTGVLVTALLVLGYALDSADGQLARLRGGGSPAGEWLDHAVDSAKVVAVHLCVLVGLYRTGELAPGWLLVPLGFAVVAVTHFSLTLLNEALRAQHGARTRAARAVPGERPSVLRSLLVAPTDYGVLCLVFVLLGATPVFLAAYGLLAVGTTGYLLLALPRWRNEMAALGRQDGTTS